MKKKILFIMDSLKIGGAEKSLVTILNMFDYDKYDVDLYLFSHTGEFYNMIPKEVNLISEDKKYSIFDKNRKVSPLKYIAKLDFKRAFYSTLWLSGALLSKLFRAKLYIGWSFINRLIDSIENDYDVSIAFLERKSIYFNIDKVHSKKKIGFIHNDYNKYPYNYKLDNKYFGDYYKIATVSENCKNALKAIFPEHDDKFIVIKNMVSKNLIIKLSEDSITDYKIDKKYINIVSVGRLVEQKGFDTAIEVCKKLVKDELNIHWYIVGEGIEKSNLEKMITDYKLENNMILVGPDPNPYKWMKVADIYVQPSRFEGYGITVAEAKVLGKVIVASDIPEFRYQLQQDEGILANSIDDFYRNIRELIVAPSLKEKYIQKKDYEQHDEELNKLLEIIN